MLGEAFGPGARSNRAGARTRRNLDDEFRLTGLAKARDRPPDRLRIVGQKPGA